MSGWNETEIRSLPESVLDALDAVVIACDPDLNVSFVNRRARNFFQINQSPKGLSPLSEFLEFAPKDWNQLRYCAQNSVIGQFDLPARNRVDPNNETDILVSLRPMTGQGNILEGWCLHCSPLDVGAKSDGNFGNIIPESKIRMSEREVMDYKYALDQSSIVAITDQKGIIQYVNDVFCKISGYAREELLGQDHRIVNSGYHSADFIKDLWTTIANGRIWRGEIKNRAKNGAFYWVDTTIVPFLNDKGKPHHYIAIRHDITERKVTEEKLVESERQHRTVVENLPGAIITIINRNQTYEMAEGDGIRRMGHSAERDYLNQHILADVTPLVYEKIKYLRSVAFEGRIVWDDLLINGLFLRVRYIPYLWKEGRVEKIMTISIDITDIKKAETDIKELNESLERKVADRTRELEFANNELEAFSYSVSHDLRAPLRIVNGFAEILVNEYQGKLDEEGQRLLSKITAGTQRMGKLIDELINLARFGRKELVFQKTDFNKLVDSVLDDLSIFNNKIILVTKPTLPIIECDTSLIRQVWTNLLSNAVKYTSKRTDSEIIIGCREYDNEFQFFVKDNGVGFDMEFKNKLFGVFQRLHKKNEFEGTGIGLAIVKRIISRHKGDVWADSQLNKGATFYFSLPKNKYHDQ